MRRKLSLFIRILKTAVNLLFGSANGSVFATYYEKYGFAIVNNNHQVVRYSIYSSMSSEIKTLLRRNATVSAPKISLFMLSNNKGGIKCRLTRKHNNVFLSFEYNDFYYCFQMCERIFERVLTRNGVFSNEKLYIRVSKIPNSYIINRGTYMNPNLFIRANVYKDVKVLSTMQYSKI